MRKSAGEDIPPFGNHICYPYNILLILGDFLATLFDFKSRICFEVFQLYSTTSDLLRKLVDAVLTL